MRLLPVAVVVLLFSLAAPRSSCAQAEATDDTTRVMASVFQEGKRSFERGRFDRAERLLQQVFTHRGTSAVSSRQKATAYWLGRAHRAQGDTSAALEVWKTGLKRLEEAQQRDPRLAADYLQLLVATGKQGTEAAAHAYRHLIGSVGRGGAALEALRTRVALLGLILPKRVRQKVATGSPWDEALREGSYAPAAGRTLLTWWRKQDPLPKTGRNERLIEHLERTAHALKRYAWPDRLSGVDDRGKTYVRFGKPYRQHTIQYNDMDFMQEVLRPGVGLSRSDFPENEIWNYSRIDAEGRYIFVETPEGHYRRGRTLDLLPLSLQRNFGRAKREQNLAYSAVAALRYIYGELALHYSNVGNLYSQVSSYMMRQEALRGVSRMDRRSQGTESGGMGSGMNTMIIGEGSGQRTVHADPSLGGVLPSSFASQVITKNKHISQQQARRRKKVMPRQHAELGEYTHAEPFPVYMRTARFLGEDGDTRTQVYWSVSMEALRLSEQQRKALAQTKFESAPYYLINFSLAEKTERYRRRVAHQERFLVKRDSSQKGMIKPQTYVVKGDTGTFHLGMQWDQYPVRIQRNGDKKSTTEIGPRTHIATRRVDSLSALSADPDRLEMSDLKPMFVQSSAALRRATDPMEVAQLYPYSNIGPDTPLLLSFEVYHPARDAGERAEYTIEYEMLRRTERGMLGQLFRGDKERSTSTRTTYTTTQHRTNEFILIELEEWTAETEGELVITVRVTDEATGQTRERSIRFGMSTESVAVQ